MMKNLLFVAIIFFYANSVFCQKSGNAPTASGKVYIFNFDSNDGNATVGWAPGCNGFKMSYTVNPSFSGSMDFSTSGEQEQWYHISLKLLNADGTPASIDLSDLENQKIEVKINSNVVIEEFLVILTDVATIHPIKEWRLSADYTPAIKTNLKSGSNIVFGTGSFDFRVWPNDPSLGDFSDPSSIISVDKTNISEIWIYVRNTKTNGCINGVGMSVAANLSIDYIKIGDAASNIVLNTFESKSYNIIVSPNPASDVINFTEAMEIVKVYNIQGNEVLSSSNTASVNVASLEAGVYVVRTEKGMSRIVVE